VGKINTNLIIHFYFSISESHIKAIQQVGSFGFAICYIGLDFFIAHRATSGVAPPH